MNDVVHKLNGQLIKIACQIVSKQVKTQIDWREWIVNTLVISFLDGPERVVSLSTSATLHFDREFFQSDDCGPNKPVRALDQPVPLDRSLAGYCARTGDLVWADSLSKFRETKLGSLYRSFGYVGVETNRAPKAEYILPLDYQSGFAHFVLGVLNFEWYASGGQETSPFEGGQNEITYSLSPLLSVHSALLGTIMALPSNVLSTTDQLVRFHLSALEQSVPE